MIAVQSYITTKYSNVEKAVRFAELSHRLLKRHGYTTTLCIENALYDRFRHIRYDNIIIFSNYFLKLTSSSTRFGLSSIYALSQLTSPSFHIDFDFFLLNNVIKAVEHERAFCAHTEPWLEHSYTNTVLGMSQQIPELKKIIGDNIPVSYNGSVFGITDMVTAQEIARQLIFIAIKYDKLFKNNNIAGTILGQTCCPYLLQQLTHTDVKVLFDIKTPDELFSQFKQQGCVHFWHPVKKHIINSNFLNNSELKATLEPFCS